MIDIESQVFSRIATRLRDTFNGIYVTGEYVKTPSSFPAVSLVEMDNVPLRRTQTSDSVENHAELMYELNVYSNKAAGKKTECKKIASVVDAEMAAMGFTRTMLNPIPNMDDATIYRILGRYKAVVSNENVLYRR